VLTLFWLFLHDNPDVHDNQSEQSHHLDVQHSLPGLQPHQTYADEAVHDAHDNLQGPKWHSPVVCLWTLIRPLRSAPG